MHRIPDILSILRLVSAPFMFAPVGRNWVIAIFVFCAFSDFLDGFLARKFNWTSKTGALLDSLGDIAFFASAMGYTAIHYFDILKELWIYIVLITGLRLLTVIICFLKYRTIFFLHTIANKVTGLCLVAGIFLLISLDSKVAIWIPLIPGILSAVEELGIMIFVPDPDLNIKSFFYRT